MNNPDHSRLPPVRTAGYLLAALLATVSVVTAGTAAAATFRNPVVPASEDNGAADPTVAYHAGYYYYVRSLSDRRLAIGRAQRLQDIGSVPMRTVFTAVPGTMYSSGLWAPQLQRIGGRWYIYFAADDGDNNHHRMYVLRADTDDPTGSWTFLGKVANQGDRWAIDASVWEYNGSLYMLYAGTGFLEDFFGREDIYIAPMSSPTAISGPSVKIASPVYGWETVGMSINEGPVMLRNPVSGQYFLIYSASAAFTEDYALGQLAFSGGNPLSASSWVKKPLPVFTKNTAAGVYAPGHNDFTVSPDGSEVWNVYHACEHAPWFFPPEWGCRSVRLKKVEWHADGSPNLGAPDGLSSLLTEPAGTPVLPDSLPLNASFDNGSTQGWYLMDGNWSAGSGALSVNQVDGAKAIADDSRYGNFSFTADVRLGNSSAWLGDRNGGLVFRASSFARGKDTLRGYYAAIDAVNDRVVLGRFDHDWTTLASVSMPISANTTYRMKVVAQGSTLKVYVNDMATPKITRTDSTYSSGSVGFRVYQVPASFDNVSVSGM